MYTRTHIHTHIHTHTHAYTHLYKDACAHSVGDGVEIPWVFVHSHAHYVDMLACSFVCALGLTFFLDIYIYIFTYTLA